MTTNSPKNSCEKCLIIIKVKSAATFQIYLCTSEHNHNHAKDELILWKTINNVNLK